MFMLKSTDVHEGELFNKKYVYDKMGAGGENISPALYWSGVPKNTKSLVLTIFDPDAPRPEGWWHWLVFNIPGNVVQLPAGIGSISSGCLPKGAIETINDYGEYGYGGPCPPVGDKPHRYQFTLYALDIDALALDRQAKPEHVMRMVSKHEVGRASFTAYYSR